MKSLRIYTQLNKFSQDLNLPGVELNMFAVSNGIVYAVFDEDVPNTIPVEQVQRLVSSYMPTVSEQLENELEPLPGTSHKTVCGYAECWEYSELNSNYCATHQGGTLDHYKWDGHNIGTVRQHSGE